MKQVESYLNYVSANLAEEQRQEVRDELASLIYAQIEEKEEVLARTLTQDELNDLLKTFGHPVKIAAAYSPNQALISEQYFPIYKQALKFGLLVYLTLAALIALPEVVISGNIIGGLIRIGFQLFETAIWVFVIITGIFYLLERNQVDIEPLYAWTPKALTQPSKKLAISRMESTFELTVYLIFFSWWMGFIDWPTSFHSNTLEYRVYLSDAWGSVSWMILSLMALSIVLCIHKIMLAGWSHITLVLNILLNIAVLAVIFLISQFDPIITIEATDSNLIKTSIKENIELSAYITLGVIGTFTIWDTLDSLKQLKD
ncbi:hypothetical protein [Aliikangiella sp. IMCC44632]